MKKLISIAAAIIVAYCHPAHADTYKVEGGCEAKFSPKGGIQAMIIRYIDGAKSEIRLLAYSFTSVPIAEALVRAHQRGVNVAVVLDKSQPTARGGQMQAMLDAGIPTYVDSKHAIAHNKTIVIDRKIYENGSFNFTFSAENSNGENAHFCHSVTGAGLYLADWERHKAHSELQQ